MSDVYVGELQDYKGNTIYPHTTAEGVFLNNESNSSLDDFLREKSDAEIDAMINAILNN